MDNLSNAASRRGGVLPFSRKELDADKAVVVQCKIMTTDLSERAAVARLVQQQIAPMKLGDKDVYLVFTDESCEMAIADAQMLAAKIVPFVAKALGMQMPLER